MVRKKGKEKGERNKRVIKKKKESNSMRKNGKNMSYNNENEKKVRQKT